MAISEECPFLNKRNKASAKYKTCHFKEKCTSWNAHEWIYIDADKKVTCEKLDFK